MSKLWTGDARGMRLNEAVGCDLEWRQPELWMRAYQLTCNGSELASIRFLKRAGLLAACACDGRRLTFRRIGLYATRVSIRETGSEMDIASFSPDWIGRGRVVFGRERRYRLRPTNFWATQWAFEAEDGNDAVRLSGPHGLFKRSGRAQVTPSGVRLVDTPVLLPLIWYVRMLMNGAFAAFV